MRCLVLALTAAAGLLSAQSGINPPRLGFIRDDSGALRPVRGVAGSFVLGEPLIEGVLSAGFSGQVGLAKTADKLLAFDSEGRLMAQAAAPGGRAEFQFAPSGTEAAVFLPDTSQWLFWQDGSFRLARRAGEERRRTAPPPPAGSQNLSAAGNELILRKADGAGLRTELTGPALWIEQMGEGWFHVRQQGRHTAVRVATDRLETYRLPEAGP